MGEKEGLMCANVLRYKGTFWHMPFMSCVSWHMHSLLAGEAFLQLHNTVCHTQY